ncbi:unnamed protein product [Rotaria sordida]|uniref:DDE-1 domain-containing protein n=2 Tax=Rotaria sordida TaxID=392033 RepID=A0A819S7Q5_9BILA|nr:unnamed protein product [Rotaria sordida]
MDLVVANNGTYNIALFVGYGNGTFASPKMYSTGSSSSVFIAIGDLNRDNRSDIAIINNDTSTIGIMLGYDEFFPIQTTYSTGLAPYSVAVGDFNNDTHLDIVVVNRDGNNISVFLGYGNGSFANQKKYSTGSSPWSVAVGDFNNDTHLDIVVANSGDNTTSVLLGYGNGSFANQMKHPTGSFPQSVAVGDFNNDTHLDIVVANYGDNTISVLIGYGNGSFANQMKYSTSSGPYSVAVGDFNNDTYLDIVVANADDDTVSVFLGYGNGSFANQTKYSTGLGPTSVAVDDFNNDNRLDIVVTNWDDNTMSVLLGYGNGFFANQMTYSTGSSPSSIAIGDFNNDTRLDIVVVNTNGENITIYLGYPKEGFLNQMKLITGNGSRPKSFAIGDFNNDGQIDVAMANSGTNNVGIFLRYGNGSFANQITYSTDTSPWAVAVGDFNSDMILDIVVANYDNKNVGVLLGWTIYSAMPPHRTLVASGYQPLIIVDKPTAYAERYDFIGAINGSQAIACMTLTPVDRRNKDIKGVRKEVVNEWIMKSLVPAINRLHIDSMHLICDRSRTHNKANMMKALKNGKCKSVIDIHYMPTASAKYISPLDNPLWHSFREVIRKQHPLTTSSLPSILSQTFYSLSRKEISGAYRKCAITYGAGVYYDKKST